MAQIFSLVWSEQLDLLCQDTSVDFRSYFCFLCALKAFWTNLGAIWMDKYNGWLSKVPKHRLLMFHFQWRTTWVLPNYLPNSAETVVNFTITKETLICEECCSFSIGCRKPRLQRLYNLKRTGRVGKKKQRDGQKIEMRRLMSSWAAGVGAAEKVVVFWTGADSLRLSALPRRRRGRRGVEVGLEARVKG